MSDKKPLKCGPLALEPCGAGWLPLKVGPFVAEVRLTLHSEFQAVIRLKGAKSSVMRGRWHMGDPQAAADDLAKFLKSLHDATAGFGE